MRLTAVALGASLALALGHTRVDADTGSANFRLIGPAPASTAGVGTSLGHRLYIVGGSGQATGISASPIYSVNAGGTSTQLPTDRLFDDGVE